MQPKSIILFFYGYILFFRRQIDHRLSFKEHESITNEGKVMRCKKCQELLFFIRSQEKTYKG
ncbi:hypothetical protein EVS34_04700 [Campylobacter coli]|nr:hypothetical protein [Campylobacter coli]EAI1257557.1 hypothetical protein [Campylobacter coli]EAJ2259713.1 hypothetical protein [Campylobacter coli]EAJ3809614.1 hypothetical protein [Campylobacter coli]EAJ6729213.1 hypothetical protein [Campylobacter coli]